MGLLYRNVSDLSTYPERIRQIAPEIGINSVNLNSEGLLNDIVVVNDEFIFRFPKHDYAFKHLKDEARILRSLQNYITLQIPSPLYETNDCLVYRMIPGETLRRDILMKLPTSDQQVIANQLGQFFKELHGVPINDEIPMADALMKYEGWVNAYERIREKVFPLLLPHVRDWVREHFESHLADCSNFEYELRMVDTDIPPYHIMYEKERRLINGIIDFGCAGLGDPAIDFGVIIYHYGESFMEKLFVSYPEAEIYVKRARFYAGAHEARWLLTGLERNDPGWFGVHLGSAKDVSYD
jgi:aminoglycoside 2''-phosphotransferase